MKKEEEDCWLKVIQHYNRLYAKKMDKLGHDADGKSEIISNNILYFQIWMKDYAYRCLGDYIKGYSYKVFKHRFFKIRNKYFPRNEKPKPDITPKPRKRKRKPFQLEIFKVKKPRKESPDPPVYEKPKPFEKMTDKEVESLGLAE